MKTMTCDETHNSALKEMKGFNREGGTHGE